MKRVFAFIIAILAIIAVLVSGIAETEKEILFRGIPWELDGETYISRLYESIGVSSPTMKWPVKKFEYCHIPVQDGVVYNAQAADFDSYLAYLPNGSTPLEVAGYKVDAWRGYGIPSIIGNTIYDGPEHIKFITWEYLFYEKDDSDAGILAADLKEKLNSLYGEGSLASTSDETIVDANVWYGANNTCVALYRAKAGASVAVTLAYSRTDAKGTVNELRDLSGVSDEANVNGL